MALLLGNILKYSEEKGQDNTSLFLNISEKSGEKKIK